MKKRMTVAMTVIMGLICVGMLYAGVNFLESVYRNDSIATPSATANAFTVIYTNTGDRVAIGSIFARAQAATGSWSILIVNSSQTNILVAPTALNFDTYGVKYEGYSTVPLGNGGKIIVSGSVASNNATTGTGIIEWGIHRIAAQ